MTQTLPNPITAAMLAPANANAGYPRYSVAGHWSGATYGDDVDQATANVALARQDGSGNEADYTPRTQAAKATATGNSLAVDVARPRGWIAPNQPYQGNATSPAAPVVSSISPNTAVAGSANPVLVTITGTGFSPWSLVKTGGVAQPVPGVTYVSATTLTFTIYPAIAVAGPTSVAVEDHDKLSNTNINFTFT